ncbi:SDR family NAD(P)-dependent oxidoreductase [Spirillospora sp. NBC_01491]|uniref:SDR family NAD(P)-dependent oxidoreductase n=1 Tax=Spirillospora sp. NBC_01491 TaxID=2976007 RepID=UPI002E2F2FD3|nr:SDR family oxidoreductase [Spirillospora sp. NBC_01491]
MSELAGRTAAITGGAGDIGAAIAAELTRRGARVTLLDVKDPAEAAGWIETASAHGPVDYVRVDVRDHAEVAAALAAIGTPDIAIAGAGIVESSPFLDITADQWRRHLDINLTGCFNFAQAVARGMVADGKRGRIVLVGSWVGEVPWLEIAAYSASKAGVAMLARSMAKELAPHGVLVNVVAPGIVAAGLAKWQLENEPAYAERAGEAIPLGYPQTAEQVARVTAFLCSADADYVTGTTLLADGGCSLFNQR